MKKNHIKEIKSTLYINGKKVKSISGSKISTLSGKYVLKLSREELALEENNISYTFIATLLPVFLK